MLVKLTPDQVAKYWDTLRPMIEIALPPIADSDNEGRMNNILARILADNMHCWVVHRDNQIFGTSTTIIQEDVATGARDLLLYSVYATFGATEEDWTNAFETLERWAVSKGCKRCVGYTQNPNIVEILNRFKAELWTYGIISFTSSI